MKYEPLTESYYYILLCLVQGRNHGYGIMQKVLDLSKKSVKIGSGTMYGAVNNMLKKKWIIESKSDNPGDERKRMYELTDLGRLTLDNEISRIEELLNTTKQVLGGMV